jgi:ABC-type multidrug transport system fused ATPase/permease subunit
MSKNSNLFDIKLFKRLLEYVLVYKTVFVFVAISAILISIFSTLTPYLIKVAVDDYLALGKYQDFIYLIIFMLFNLLLIMPIYLGKKLFMTLEFSYLNIFWILKCHILTSLQ